MRKMLFLLPVVICMFFCNCKKETKVETITKTDTVYVEVHDTTTIPALISDTITTLIILRHAEKESTGKALSQIGGLPLTELEIYDKQTTDEAIGYVATISTLRLLSISNSQEITDAAVDSLLKLRALEELKIGPTKLTDAGLARLAGLKSLKKLALTIPKKSRTPTVTEAGVESLKKARPDLTLEVN